MQQGAAAANPVERVQKSVVKADKTRRALSVAEIQRLLKAAPQERSSVYLVLVWTGLRRGEARELRWGHVHLEVANPFLELPASITKSGRPESVALVPEAAQALRSRRGDARDQERVFDPVPSMDAFRADVAAAGIDDTDARGRKVVLHSLRHSLATMLAQSNVPPAIAMKILRHRDVRLTLQIYTDEGLLHTAAAMATLPRITAS